MLFAMFILIYSLVLVKCVQNSSMFTPNLRRCTLYEDQSTEVNTTNNLVKVRLIYSFLDSCILILKLFSI